MSQQKKRQRFEADKVIVRAGLCSAVACAPKAMKPAEVIRQALLELGPSGTAAGWRLSRKRKLDDGTKLPAPCLEDTKRVHHLLEC